MRSVRFKIALSMFLLSLLAMAVVLYTLFQPSLESLRNNEIHYNVEATNQTKYAFSSLFDSVHKTVRMLSNNTAIHSVLYAVEEATPEQTAQTHTELSELLSAVSYPNEAVAAIHIIGDTDWKFFSSEPLADEAGIRQTCEELMGDAQVRKQYAFTDVVTVDYGGGRRKQVVQFITPINKLANAGRLGYIVVDIDCVILEETFLFASYKSDDKAMIAQQNGNILFNFPKTAGMDSVLRDYPELLSEKECIIDGMVFGAQTMIVSDTMDYTGWRIIRLIPVSSVTKDTQSIVSLMVKIVAIFLVVSLAISLWISGILTRSVKKLLTAFQQAENGDMDVRVQIRSRDEMGKLGSAFNSMMYKLNDYFNRELEMQKKKSDMELEVLESQINPHFLYNTLDSIRWLAVLQNVDNIARMTAALISLLRYNLSKDGPTVTLKQELESVEDYMLVQQYRYGTGLELSHALAPETLDLEMPRFLLQPLVENCIIHAYGQMDEIGRIFIESEISEDRLVIRVIDEGRGMGGDLDFKTRPESKGTRFKNIGITNIRERIRLYCGEGYGLRYRPADGGGTIAEIFLPVKRRMC